MKYTVMVGLANATVDSWRLDIKASTPERAKERAIKDMEKRDWVRLRNVTVTGATVYDRYGKVVLR